MAEESVQPVPCVFPASIFSAVKRATASRVTAGRSRRRACAWPPLISTALAPTRQRLRLRAHLGLRFARWVYR